MITQKRAAYYSANKTTELAGRSIDTKPTNVPNGSEYTEIDTGRVYVFDAENFVWRENQAVNVSGVAAVVSSYTDLTDKPTINGVEIIGNKTSDQFGLLTPTSAQIIDLENKDTDLQNKIDKAGDMRKDVYDSTNAVANRGGIAAYVNIQLQDKQNKTDVNLDTTSKTVVGAINEIKDAVNAISSVANIVVVDTKPDTPTQNTLYYVGTESPYQIWLYTTKWYDMGTTEIGLNQYAKITYVDNQLELKQDSLSEAQMNVVNSGVTAESFANKAGVDLKNVTNDVFKNKVENCGANFGIEENAVTINTNWIFSWNSIFSSFWNTAYISNGIVVYRPEITVRNELQSGTVVVIKIPADKVFNDNNGKKWKILQNSFFMYDYAFGKVAGSDTLYPLCTQTQIMSNGSVTYNLIVPADTASANISKLYCRIELPIVRAD